MCELREVLGEMRRAKATVHGAWFDFVVVNLPRVRHSRKRFAGPLDVTRLAMPTRGTELVLIARVEQLFRRRAARWS